MRAQRGMSDVKFKLIIRRKSEKFLISSFQ